MKEELIEKAEKFCVEVGIPIHMAKYVMEFATSVVREAVTGIAKDCGLESERSPVRETGWVPIRDADDLPKVEGRYLWVYPNAPGISVAQQFNPNEFMADVSKKWFTSTYVAWHHLPAPYRTPEEQG